MNNKSKINKPLSQKTLFSGKSLLFQLKELELENKLLKEQLNKAFPVVSLEKISKKDYLIKKYGKLIWWIEFLIILCIKDISRWILTTFQIAPSDFLKWILKSLKGGKANG